MVQRLAFEQRGKNDIVQSLLLLVGKDDSLTRLGEHVTVFHLGFCPIVEALLKRTEPLLAASIADVRRSCQSWAFFLLVECTGSRALAADRAITNPRFFRWTCLTGVGNPASLAVDAVIERSAVGSAFLKYQVRADLF